MPRTYVDNKMNRELGRVGMPHGSAVHSSKSSSSSSSSGYGSSSSHRTYVDNPMNRMLDRVGMEHGTAVHSRSETPRSYMDNTRSHDLYSLSLPQATAVHSTSSSHRTYVDNPMNRMLDRVGLEHGTAVHSRSETPRSYMDNTRSHDLYSLSLPQATAVHSTSSSHRTYVDNPMNRMLDRVGMEHGTAVHSRSDTPRTYMDNTRSHDLYSVSLPQATAVHSMHETSQTYVDNALNRSLGRVGMPHGTAVHSKSESPKTYVDNAVNRELGRVGMPHGSAVHSKSESPKKYVDNAVNRELGRVGMPHGSAVHSKGSEKQKSSNGREVNQPLVEDVTQHSSSSVKSQTKVYVDNEYNRRHNRVGLPLGSVPISRKNELYQASRLNSKQQEPPAVNSNEKPCLTQQKKVYVDNAFNRKHKRVGLPLGSVPISKQKEVYTESPLNRKLHRVGKPWGTPTGRENKMAALHQYLEEHSDEEIPQEFEDMSDDTFSSVLECKQRDKTVATFLEETPNNDWQSHEHTSRKTIEKYKGKIIDFDKVKILSQIGHGSFGEVYFASLESGEAVAVKMLKCQQVTKRRLQLFRNEMDLFLELDHPNIVSFVGACTEVPNLAIIMELMDMSLFDALHIKEVDFSVNNKLEITKGVTKGVAYLHSKHIAHCDLKTKNVLLINVPDQDLTDASKPVLAKITDFGLSKMKSDTVTSSSMVANNIGTPLYSAPEIHQGKILSLEDLKKADVFSMGLVIWELAVEEIPFEDYTLQQLKVQVGEKGQTPVPSVPLRLDGKLQATLSLCWSMNPVKRPSAEALAKIVDTLTDLLDEKEE